MDCSVTPLVPRRPLSLTAAAAAQDFIIAAVIRPDNTGFYHNIIDDDAQTSPMLWVRPGFEYELNFGSNNAPAGSTGSGGWDIIIADSKLNQIYRNIPTANVSGRDATDYPTARPFDFFHRDGAQTFRGKVAELRIYNDRAAINGGFSGLHNELFAKWIGTPYTLWAAANVPAGQDSAFDGDVNGNGLTNGVEYVFGPLPPGFTGTSGIPVPAFIPPDVNDYLDRSPGLTPASWSSVVSWVNGVAPFFAGGLSIVNGEVRDATNQARAFYRFRVVQR